jgi:MFS family permease
VRRPRTAIPSAARAGVVPFLVTFAAFTALMASANLPTTLYAVYADEFGFSSLVVTLVFATYAVVLAPSLLTFGQLSDRAGRRRVMAIGLGVSIVAMALFASAQGTAWLFAARAVQGVAVGAMSGTASAALVELEPDGDRARAAMVATLAQAGGSGLGALVGGVLAQYAADPLVLPFVVWSVVVAICIVAVLRLPEPAVAASGRWSIRRPSVPAEIRRGFARASLSAGAVWAVGALFLSLVPSYAGELLDTDNLAVLGALGGVMLGASCVTQIVGQRRAMSPARAQPLGLVVVMAGLVLLVLAFPAASLALILGSALLTGAGHGFTFLGAQADINDLAPPERRGEVTAAFATAVYLCVALPVVGLGVLTQTYSLQTSIALFSLVVGATCLVAAVWHLRGRGEAPAAA